MVIRSSYTILHSYQQCMRVPLFSHLCQHLLVSDPSSSQMGPGEEQPGEEQGSAPWPGDVTLRDA